MTGTECAWATLTARSTEATSAPYRAPAKLSTQAVRSERTASSPSVVSSNSTIRAPVSVAAYSKPSRWRLSMTISRLFTPSRCGNAATRCGSEPAIQAATPRVIPAAAPDTTYPASLCVSSARRDPTRSCNSTMSTNDPAASTIDSSTGPGMSEPPSVVSVAAALMTGRSPSAPYQPEVFIVAPGRSGPSALCPVDEPTRRRTSPHRSRLFGSAGTSPRCRRAFRTRVVTRCARLARPRRNPDRCGCSHSRPVVDGVEEGKCRGYCHLCSW